MRDSFVALSLLTLGIGSAWAAPGFGQPQDFSAGFSAAPSAERVEWSEDLSYAISAIETQYAYPATGIDWDELRTRYGERLMAVENGADFFQLIEQLVEELHDHHAHLNRNDSNSFRLVPSGTDAWVEFVDGAFMLVDVREGSPAQDAGLRGGLRIVAIDGVDVADAVADRLSPFADRDSDAAKSWAARTLVAGRQSQTEIQLSVEDGRGAVRVYDYARGWAPEAEGMLTRSEEEDHGAWSLRIENSLGQNALVAEFDAAMEWAKEASELVLDLTNTPGGGNSDIARALLGHFTAEEMPYQRHEFVERPLDVPRIWIERAAPRGAAPFLGNVMVLVNHWTGSMGEGLALGLDTLPNVTVIGTPMAGLKGATEYVDLPHASFGFYLPTQRLSHVDGTPRELWQPETLVTPVPWDTTAKELEDAVTRRLIEGTAQGRWLSEIPEWIASSAHGLESVEPSFGTDDDLAWLNERTAGVRILGMGEATHGTSEFFRVRHRMTRYLVEHAGFNVVAFETSAAAATLCDRYVCGADLTIEEAMDGLRMAVWQVEEVQALLVDLRAINAEREQPVRFLGVDMQSPGKSTEWLLGVLAEVDPALEADWSGQLDRFLSLVNQKSEDPEADTPLVQASLRGLRKLWEDNASAYGAKLGAERYAETARQMNALDQNMDIFTTMSWAHRDEGMAENTLGIFDVLGQDAKMLLWAHNGHVFNGRLSYTPDKSLAMGGHLKEALGDEYYALGLFFGEGQSQANGVDEEGKLNFKRYHFDEAPFQSLESYFASAGVGPTILDLAEQPSDKALGEWFDHRHGCRVIGGYNVPPDMNLRTRHARYLMPVQPAADYDGLLYLPQVTAATPINRGLIDPFLYGN